MPGIGKTIQIIRQARGVALNDLARKARVSTAYLSLIENGKRDPSLAVLRRLGKALRVPPELLVLLGQPRSSALRVDDERIQQMVRSVRRLKNAEEKLRDALD